jgi:hypothetical protein
VGQLPRLVVGYKRLITVSGLGSSGSDYLTFSQFYDGCYEGEIFYKEGTANL